MTDQEMMDELLKMIHICLPETETESEAETWQNLATVQDVMDAIRKAQKEAANA